MNVWIVEIWTGKRWEPTVGTSLDRKHARDELREWREVYPLDKLRLRKYVREGK